jgi:hypothetical protein
LYLCLGIVCTYYFNNVCQSIFVKLFTGYFLGGAAEEVSPETEVAGKQQRGPAGSGRGRFRGQDARHTAPDWLTRRAWHTRRCHHQVAVVAIVVDPDVFGPLGSGSVIIWIRIRIWVNKQKSRKTLISPTCDFFLTFYL